jgi:serine/threonine-protein kinase
LFASIAIALTTRGDRAELPGVRDRGTLPTLQTSGVDADRISIAERPGVPTSPLAVAPVLAAAADPNRSPAPERLGTPASAEHAASAAPSQTAEEPTPDDDGSPAEASPSARAQLSSRTADEIASDPQDRTASRERTASRRSGRDRDRSAPSPPIPAIAASEPSPPPREPTPTRTSRWRVLDANNSMTSTVSADDPAPAIEPTPVAATPVPSRSQGALALANGYYQAGAKLLISGDIPAAKRKFRTSLSVVRGYAPAYRGLGLAHERTGDRASAVRAYKNYLRLAPRAKDAESIRTRMARLGS